MGFVKGLVHRLNEKLPGILAGTVKCDLFQWNIPGKLCLDICHTCLKKGIHGSHRVFKPDKPGTVNMFAVHSDAHIYTVIIQHKGRCVDAGNICGGCIYRRQNAAFIISAKHKDQQKDKYDGDAALDCMV